MYTYNKGTLWIAYGIAMAFTAMAVAGGLTAMILDSASYSNYFSSILRISRTARLSTKIQPQDGTGQDPLPDYLKVARLHLGHGDGRESTYTLLEVPSDELQVISERKSHGR